MIRGLLLSKELEKADSARPVHGCDVNDSHAGCLVHGTLPSLLGPLLQLSNCLRAPRLETLESQSHQVAKNTNLQMACCLLQAGDHFPPFSPGPSRSGPASFTGPPPHMAPCLPAALAVLLPPSRLCTRGPLHLACPSSTLIPLFLVTQLRCH